MPHTNVWESFYSCISTFYSTKANIFTSKTSCLLGLLPSSPFYIYISQEFFFWKSQSWRILQPTRWWNALHNANWGNRSTSYVLMDTYSTSTKGLCYICYLLCYTQCFFTAHGRMQKNLIYYNHSVNLQVASAGVPVGHTETLSYMENNCLSTSFPCCSTRCW